MEVWPAIDIRGGKCVRLCQGDYGREIVFNSDPVAIAHHWVTLGARRLHIVDLDGAKIGEPVNFDIVQRIFQESGVPCQFGGGVRDETTISRLLDAGASRVVVGTRAVKDPDWFRAVVRKFPRRIVLGLDVRAGRAATDGWLEISNRTAAEIVAEFADESIAAVVFTDISADGMLSGVSLEAFRHMQQVITVPLIASGGVTTLEDIRALKEIGVTGCIIGRALYEGRLNLPEVLAIAEDKGSCQ
ncbi:MAG: 1-(5-phosphoribosyl)-5-[(5-phosphoribosylamino)methylideneamino]imidazole-4-carboxamide isomerase [Thermogutta sp.]